MSLGDEVRGVARCLIDAYQDVLIDYGVVAAAARSLADTSRRVEEMNDRADTTTDTHAFCKVAADILEALVDTNRVTHQALGWIAATLEPIAREIDEWAAEAAPSPGPPANVVPMIRPAPAARPATLSPEPAA